MLARERPTGIAPSVADRLLDTAGGNPLALVELPSCSRTRQLAGREPLEPSRCAPAPPSSAPSACASTALPERRPPGAADRAPTRTRRGVDDPGRLRAAGLAMRPRSSRGGAARAHRRRRRSSSAIRCCAPPPTTRPRRPSAAPRTPRWPTPRRTAARRRAWHLAALAVRARRGRRRGARRRRARRAPPRRPRVRRARLRPRRPPHARTRAARPAAPRGGHRRARCGEGEQARLAWREAAAADRRPAR